ncbi:unnamed protein product [Cladocopium goreaui]|uniref:Secreted protein n=1 Tax=Cladocopium goreaui TaxID=2562237 RepID=A0A9P1BS65_9DINO|nr:unnamed protein product [Cladocopium goreaui]
MLKCPKVLALCILMIIWTPTFKCNQEYQLFEFFAGNANLSKCARASGLTTASFDILFDAQKPGCACILCCAPRKSSLQRLRSSVRLGPR